jgi:predicted Fe-Mo cluster-binding NifX family protein
MLIAIPTFGSRISPRFDCAATLMIAEILESSITDRREEPIGHMQCHDRIAFLKSRNIDVVLCGGIRRCDFYYLTDAGIDVCPGLFGEAEHILEAFSNGEISLKGIGGGMWWPGGGRGRRWGLFRGSLSSMKQRNKN